MAVKVKLQKKKPAPVKFKAADFAHPDELRSKLVGLAVGVGAIAVVLGLLALVPLRPHLQIAWGAWTLLALVYYLRGNRRELRRMMGDARGARGATPEAVADMVAKQARALGVVAEVAVVAEAQEIATLGNTIVVPQEMQQRLSPAEMWSLIARQMGHVKAGSVRLRNLCRRVDQEKLILLRGLGLPLRPLARALAHWRWHTELTADRMALVLTRDRKVVAAALLKGAVGGADGVSVAEIDEYLKRPGSLTVHSAEVTTHFKLGQVLRDRGELMHRLRGIAQYAESEEYKQACERLDTAQRKDQPQAGPPTSSRDEDQS